MFRIFLILPNCGQWDVGRFIFKNLEIKKKKVVVAVVPQSAVKCSTTELYPLYPNLNSGVFSATRRKRPFWFCFLSVPLPFPNFPFKAPLLSQRMICRLSAAWEPAGSWVKVWPPKPGTLDFLSQCLEVGHGHLRFINQPLSTSGAQWKLKAIACTSCAHPGLLPDGYHAAKLN